MIRKSTILASCVVCLLGAPLATAGDADPDAAIKYRKSVMSAVGGHIGGLVAILKGEIDQPDSLATHADGFAIAATHSATSAAFQQNTDGLGSEQTTSTGKIWEDWARFDEALKAMEVAALDIQEAAAKGELTSFDQLKPALKQCGFCHRESGFREKQ
jgi:cytochrome c556